MVLIPDNEVQRLSALLRFQILDTDEDEVYNTICSLAASIMEAPVALISLIDSDRQWFKSKIGVELSETSREHSFCSVAILTPEEQMVIKDASIDDRFSDNPFVVGEPKIRFYFGTPLVTSNNEAIGTICTIDSIPRKAPTQFQMNALKSLSKLVMAHLEVREYILNIQSEVENLSKYYLASTELRLSSEVNEMYKRLNDNCDSVLEKIKARKRNKEVLDRLEQVKNSEET